MGRQRRRQSEGTQQTRVRAWAGSVKGQVHDKSRTREPFGERCGQMSDTWFGERDFRWADVGHCIPQTYVAEDGQNGFGLFMGEFQIVQVYFYGRDVTWNARVLNARARLVTDVRHSYHHEHDKMEQEGRSRWTTRQEARTTGGA